MMTAAITKTTNSVKSQSVGRGGERIEMRLSSQFGNLSSDFFSLQIMMWILESTFICMRKGFRDDEGRRMTRKGTKKCHPSPSRAWIFYLIPEAECRAHIGIIMHVHSNLQYFLRTSPEELRDSLVKMELDKFDLDKLLALRGISPSSEDLPKLKGFDGDVKTLDEVRSPILDSVRTVSKLFTYTALIA